MENTLTSRSILRLFMSSMISLFVILLFVLLLTRMEQGITIVIDMFESWSNLLLTILVINFLALILSHFPYYFDLAIRDDNKQIEWIKDYKLTLFSFIYHNTSFDPKDNILVKMLRRHIGILMYAIWFLVLLNVKKNVFNNSIDVNSRFVIWNIIFIVIHLSIQAHQKEIKSQIKTSIQGSASFNKLKKVIRNYLIFYQVLFFLNVITICYFLYKVNETGWNKTNLNLLIIICTLNALLYISFRISRSWFVYYSRGKGVAVDTTKYYSQSVGTDFTVYSFLPFRYLASTPNYLAAMSIFGLLFTVPIITVGTITTNTIQYINPIPLLIIIVIFYYSAIVITLKHFIYHKSNADKTNKKKHTIISRLLMILPFGILVLFFYMANIDNDLHTLQLVSSDKQPIKDMTKSEFVNGIDTTLDNHYFIGSYGGGLKANIWNLLLLNEISKRDNEFLKSTLCISGVSGGAIGIANYTAIKNNYKGHNYDLNEKIIDDIGRSNMLSNDLFGWLFKDFWREGIPGSLFSFHGKDRANLSMELYSNMIHDMDNALNIPMRHYWKNTYDKHGYYPAIIFNTTPTTSNYGVACSVKGLKFPISIDILEFEKDESNISQSLSFFGAASTTNRFPLFSPTARIPTKGHFVDGGYFENSGLLNAKRFYDELKKDTLLNLKKVSAINIINDKGLYILEKLRSYDITSFKSAEKHEGEFISILNGIVALERLPRYMREIIKEDKDIELLTLQMPYPFDINDVKKIFQVELLSDDDLKKLEEIINDNNLEITKALKAHKYDNNRFAYDYEKWGVVVPPLGRLLSRPAVEYQRAMVKYHPDIKKVLDQLVKE